ncbi:protein kinase [Spirillospora sp. NPDC052242]
MTGVDPLLPGDPARLGPYELAGRLGEGGQSIVYLGRREDGAQAAVKLLRAQLSRNPEWRSRFERELGVIGRVAGFCTAQVLDADFSGDTPYVVSEYVPGPSLSALVGERGPRTGTDLDRLAIGTVTALAAIHRAGILHRDFKPSNVLMGPDGPRVIDFGIARVLGSSSSRGSGIMGTPSYMAPEQIADGDLGTGVDMFAWAATMLFAATGRHPFGNDNISAVFHRILQYEPDMSALPDSLRAVVAACLAKDPARRPEAQQVLLDLLGGAAPAASAGPGGVRDDRALSTGAQFAAPSHVPPHAPTHPMPRPPAPADPNPHAAPGPDAERPGPSAPPFTDPHGAPSTNPRTSPPGVGGHAANAVDTVPPVRRRRGLRIAALALPLVLLAGGGTTWAVLAAGSGEPDPPPAAGSAAPPPAAAAAVRPAEHAITTVLSFDHASYERNVTAAHGVATERYGADYDRQLAARDYRAELEAKDGSVTTDIADSAVVSAAPDAVTVLAYVKRTVRASGAEPDLLADPMRATMVRRGDRWLLDTLYTLKAGSPRARTTGAAWPGDRAEDVLSAVARHPSITAGTIVDAGLRPGASGDEVTALVALGACTSACDDGDGIGFHRLRVGRAGDGWRVIGAQEL